MSAFSDATKPFKLDVAMLIATAFFSQATLRFALLGLATGALTALVALSMVIVYRVSGVLNFSAAALGAIGAFVCYSLRDDSAGRPPRARRRLGCRGRCWGS